MAHRKVCWTLRDSELKDDVMLDAFYDRIIETYYHPEKLSDPAGARFL